jgi:hypothetical protein
MVWITIVTMLDGKTSHLGQIQMLTLIPSFSERDLIMRYHWGLGVGHVHAHRPAATTSHIPEEVQGIHSPEHEPEETAGGGNSDNDLNAQLLDENSDVYNSDDPELGLEDCDPDGWEDVESDNEEGGDGGEDMEEEEFSGL